MEPLRSQRYPSSTKALSSSDRTQDSGYASDPPVNSRSPRPQEPYRTGVFRSPDPKISEPSSDPTIANTKGAMVQTGPSLYIQNCCSGDLTPNFRARNGSVIEPQTLAGTLTEDSPPKQVTAQDIEITTADTPFTDLTEVDDEDEHSVLNDGTISRSPSPWQVTNSAESEKLLVQTLWRFVNVFNELANSQGDADSSPGNSGATSPVVLSMDGARVHPSGSGSGSSSRPTFEIAGFATGTDFVRSKKARGGSDSARDSDGDEDEPNRKRPRLLTPESTSPRPRFACPYQKYDAMGSPFCYVRTNKNPEGGADTFSRVK